MAYDKKKIYEQAITVQTMGVKEGIEYFTKEKQFNTEKDFTESLLSVLTTMYLLNSELQWK